jgi:hypothetical protein
VGSADRRGGAPAVNGGGVVVGEHGGGTPCPGWHQLGQGWTLVARPRACVAHGGVARRRPLQQRYGQGKRWCRGRWSARGLAPYTEGLNSAGACL